MKNKNNFWKVKPLKFKLLRMSNVKHQSITMKSTYRGKRPFDDYDKDGVANWKDCKPYNPKKQGKIHDYLKQKIAKRQDKKEAQRYIVIKFTGEMYQTFGPYTESTIEQVYNQTMQQYADRIEDVFVSPDKSAANIENARIERETKETALSQTVSPSERIQQYVTGVGEGVGENIEQGLQLEKLKRGATDPRGRGPPHTKSVWRIGDEMSLGAQPYHPIKSDKFFAKSQPFRSEWQRRLERGETYQAFKPKFIGRKLEYEERSDIY